MKLAVLFSGGKDSTYALYKAMKTDEVVCLVSVVSENKESYMFHTPNISLTKLQAEAIGLPLIQKTTPGKKEEELEQLKEAIQEAKEMYGVEGVVSGAVESVYQGSRVQRICHDLDLYCFNPLWKKDQVELLQEIVDAKFEVIISGVFAYPFNESWLGRILNQSTIKELQEFQQAYQINPAGEGGEFETTVLHTPFFKKHVKVKDAKIEFSNHAGVFHINEARLE